jgi:hypothetical protein
LPADAVPESESRECQFFNLRIQAATSSRRQCVCRDFLNRRAARGKPHSWFQALVCGRKSPGSSRPLVHTGVCCGLGAVNNFQLRILRIVDWPVLQGVSPRARLVFAVNNCVDNNPLSKREIVIRCWQFIERAETDGSGQQIEAESLQDNPR